MVVQHARVTVHGPWRLRGEKFDVTIMAGAAPNREERARRIALDQLESAIGEWLAVPECHAPLKEILSVCSRFEIEGLDMRPGSVAHEQTRATLLDLFLDGILAALDNRTGN